MAKKSSGGAGGILGGGKLLSGLTMKNPKGDSGLRAEKQGESMNADATRDKVGRGHTLGGRTA